MSTGTHRRDRRTPPLASAFVYAILIVACVWGLVWGLSKAFSTGLEDVPTPQLTNEPSPTPSVTVTRLVRQPAVTVSPSPLPAVTVTATATRSLRPLAARAAPAPTVWRTRYVRVPGPTETSYVTVTPTPEERKPWQHR